MPGNPISGISAILGAIFNQAISGPAIEEQGKYQRAMDFLNQQAAEVGAGDALDRGAQAAGQARMAGSQLIAKQKVGYAAAGVDVQSGSALDAMADARMLSELDAQKLRNNAAREALGYKMKAYQYGMQRKLDMKRTENALTANTSSNAGQEIGGFASFLGG